MTSQTEIKNVFFLNLKIILDYKQEVPLVLRAEFGITETAPRTGKYSSLGRKNVDVNNIALF
jgi:hypothetical protein